MQIMTYMRDEEQVTDRRQPVNTGSTKICVASRRITSLMSHYFKRRIEPQVAPDYTPAARESGIAALPGHVLEAHSLNVRSHGAANRH